MADHEKLVNGITRIWKYGFYLDVPHELVKKLGAGKIRRLFAASFGIENTPCKYANGGTVYRFKIGQLSNSSGCAKFKQQILNACNGISQPQGNHRRKK